MQTDGFRVDGDVTYLTQLTDLSGNGNDAVQSTATAQAYLDGSDAVFSGAQWYNVTGTETDSGSTCIAVCSSGTYGRVMDTDSGTRIAIDFNGFVYAPADGYTAFIDLGSVFPLAISNVNSLLVIGRLQTGSNYLAGTISTLAIYNKTLTTTEQTIVNKCLTILGA